MKRLILAALCVAVAVPVITGPAWAEGGREAIHEAADQVQPLLPGMSAPAFNVLDVNGAAVAFQPGALQRPLVLTFFRGGWCPYCNLHLSEMRHAEQQLNDMGFDVVFVSIDQPSMLAASLDEPEIGYTLWSDSKLEATRAFGIAFRMDDETFARYVEHGHDLEGASGESHHVLPAPSTFIIGADGVIRFAYTNPDYAVRLHPDVLMAAAGAVKAEADKRLRARRKAQREAGG